MLYFPGVRLEVSGVSVPLCRCPRRPVPDSGARWVSHNRGEAEPLTSLTQVTAVWWGSIPPAELQRLSPAPLVRLGSAPHPGGRRARTAGRCPEYPPAGSAGSENTLQLLHEEAEGGGGGEKKVCQAACSQWACMDALVQTRSYRSATPLPVSGLNEILSRRKCHDLERLLQSHSTSRTTAVRQRLTSSGALVITTHLTGCVSICKTERNEAAMESC